jgi:hypothetical protein
VNKLPTEVCAVVGTIDPDAYTASTYTTGYIPLGKFRRYLAILSVGTLGTAAVVNAKLIAYTDGSGTGPLDVPGAAITPLTQAGTDADKYALINFNPEILAGSTRYTHFRLSVTNTVEAMDAAAVVLGFDPLYGPASDNDLATVDEIVSV